MLSTLAAIIISMFSKDTRLTVSKFFDALENGAKSTLTVACACGVAGIIAGVITMTGLGQQIITAIVGVSGGHLIVAMMLTMLTCIVLGMGVPTTANYCIMAATCALILVQMGVPQPVMRWQLFQKAPAPQHVNRFRVITVLDIMGCIVVGR